MARTAIQERDALKRVYRSRLWAQKVDKMQDKQVIDIYQRLRRQGMI